jgi:hypothetical protein
MVAGGEAQRDFLVLAQPGQIGDGVESVPTMRIEENLTKGGFGVRCLASVLGGREVGKVSGKQ